MNKLTILPLVLLTGMQVTPDKQEERTPVIIIMADQLRYDAIGEFTPNINGLKEDGISFNRAYTASPLCVPSRGSFFTGLYPNNNGSLINGWSPVDLHYREVRSGIPDLYETMDGKWDSRHVGKQHFFTRDKIDKDPASKTKWITRADYQEWMKENDKPLPGGKRFKAKCPELISNRYTEIKTYSIPQTGIYKPGTKYYFDHFIGSKVVDIINNHGDDEKPLLINAMFLAPHPPFDVPEPYYSKIKASEITVPENVGMWYEGQSPLQMYNLTGFLGSRYSRDEWSAVWPKYLGLVSLLDDEVGRIVKALKAKGLYDKSLIIFLSDHGEMLGSHSLWQKMCMYEESVRVPLVIKFPSDFHPGIKETDEPVSLVDVWPTLKDFLSIRDGNKTDGMSLMPLVNGRDLRRENLFIQYDGNGAYGNNQRCVVHNNLKLIVDTFKDEYYLELYDVIEDPMEKNNLALNPAFQKDVERLLEQLRQYMSGSNDLLKLPVDIYPVFMKRYVLKEIK